MVDDAAMMEELRCHDCGKMVRNKRLFGWLHVCATDEEIRERRRLAALAQNMIMLQSIAPSPPWLPRPWRDMADLG